MYEVQDINLLRTDNFQRTQLKSGNLHTTTDSVTSTALFLK